jgi:hypothetical protein
MNDEEAGAVDARQGPPPNADSIQASIERLIASGKDLAEAEISWAKLKGRSLADTFRRGIFFAILATAGLMVGFSLLLVAGIMALAPFVGFLYATLIVIGIAFAFSILFGWLARQSFRQLMGAGD